MQNRTLLVERRYGDKQTPWRPSATVRAYTVSVCLPCDLLEFVLFVLLQVLPILVNPLATNFSKARAIVPESDGRGNATVR